LKIIHHITIQQKEAPLFQGCGVEPEFVDGGGLVHIATIDIAEDDPRWSAVSRLVQKLKVLDIPATQFSDDELLHSGFLSVLPGWLCGYPQPEDDYLAATYDLSNYCRICGIGKKQIHPFRMKREPAWGTRSILQMNWVFDEYFVRPEIWQKVFEPLGIGSRPVLHYKSGDQLQSVVQLDIRQIVALKIENLPFTECTVCSQKKYSPRVNGFFPAPSSAVVLAKSTQYLGSGANAFQQILISHELYTRIKEAKMKGVEFQACRQN
jgi:hypothetical protein